MFGVGGEEATGEMHRTRGDRGGRRGGGGVAWQRRSGKGLTCRSDINTTKLSAAVSQESCRPGCTDPRSQRIHTDNDEKNPEKAFRQGVEKMERKRQRVHKREGAMIERTTGALTRRMAKMKIIGVEMAITLSLAQEWKTME